MRKSKSDLIKVIYDGCENANKELKCDFAHWYKYDFETEIGITNEDDLKECSENEIEESKMDYLHSIRNQFSENVLNYFVEAGYVKNSSDDKYNELVEEEVWNWLTSQNVA